MRNALTSRNNKHKKNGIVLHFPAGTDPLHLDHSVCRIYQLRAGRVRLSHGREAILDYLTRGAFFGEECLLPSRQRLQRARCISPVTVSAFRSSQVLDRVQHDRQFASRLVKNLAARLNRYGQTIRDFVAESAEQRLARLLARLAPNKPASGWVRLWFSPSNAEFARTVGTTRWRISHFLQHFRQLGWLDRRPEIWIRQEGLREYLQPAAGKIPTRRN
jgi:CRP/FNR family transcriptional regulator, cyclic AMP receptor protein